jgi:hypothetical protein
MSAVSGRGGTENTNITSSKYKGHKTGFMEIVGSRGNASDSYTENARFDSRPGHVLSQVNFFYVNFQRFLLWFSSVPLDKFLDITLL